MTTVTTEQTNALAEQIGQALEGYEPKVHEIAISIVVHEEADDESVAVDLTLADPPRGKDTWELERLDELALVIERIVAGLDLPSAVISVTPISREEFEDDPATR